MEREEIKRTGDRVFGSPHGRKGEGIAVEAVEREGMIGRGCRVDDEIWTGVAPA